MFNKIIDKNQMPQEWETGMVINIHKKGTKSKCENYKGITLLPTAYRLFANIIKQQTKRTFGRQNGRGTMWLSKETQLYRCYIQGATDN